MAVDTVNVHTSSVTVVCILLFAEV